jgi:hypothetical protein
MPCAPTDVPQNNIMAAAHAAPTFRVKDDSFMITPIIDQQQYALPAICQFLGCEKRPAFYFPAEVIFARTGAGTPGKIS